MNAKRPSLEIRINGYGRRMLASVSTGLLSCGVLGGALALIVSVSHHFTENESETVEPIIARNGVTPKTQNPEPAFIPLNVISVATSPLTAPRIFAQPERSPAKEALIPPTNSFVLNDLELEELDFDNPFSKPKTPAKKSTRAKTIAKSSSKQSSAILAKKITKQATLISSSVPTYPRSAQRKGIEGDVVVIVTIGASGKISSTQISRSSGSTALDNSALAAARKHRFSPAINGLGQTVAVKRAIPFNFRLRG